MPNNENTANCNTNRIQNSAGLVYLTQGGDSEWEGKAGRPAYKCRRSSCENLFIYQKMSICLFKSKGFLTEIFENDSP